MVLSGRDLPDGNFKELERSGAKQKSNSRVELTMTNVAAFYFYEYHGMSPLLSSVFASIFGLVNLCARSLGGMWSDAASAKYGMRGRIWSLWFWQSVEGALCIVMALITLGYDAPEDGKPLINGWAQVGATWENEDGVWKNKDGPWTEFVAPTVEGKVAAAFDG